MSAVVKQHINRKFSLHGLMLQADASKYLAGLLTPLRDDAQKTEWLKRILDCVLKSTLESPIVTRAQIESAVNECTTGDDEGDEQMMLQVCNYLM